MEKNRELGAGGEREAGRPGLGRIYWGCSGKEGGVSPERALGWLLGLGGGQSVWVSRMKGVSVPINHHWLAGVESPF